MERNLSGGLGCVVVKSSSRHALPLRGIACSMCDLQSRSRECVQEKGGSGDTSYHTRSARLSPILWPTPPLFSSTRVHPEPGPELELEQAESPYSRRGPRSHATLRYRNTGLNHHWWKREPLQPPTTTTAHTAGGE
eukprot:1157922-Pelagomonas_calceolata.AAC.17